MIYIYIYVILSYIYKDKERERCISCLEQLKTERRSSGKSSTAPGLGTDPLDLLLDEARHGSPVWRKSDPCRCMDNNLLCFPPIRLKGESTRQVRFQACPHGIRKSHWEHFFSILGRQL